MNLFIITSIILAAIVAIGALLAALVVWFSRAVVKEQETASKERESYNPSVTMGHRIPVDAELEEQIKAAKREAARRAALLPRGANMRIGQLNGDKQPTAHDGVEYDPISAVKIAQFHGWEGVRTGATAEPDKREGVKPAAEAVAPVKSADDLVPGEDYPYIEITDDMKPAEVRKARIANAKAKAAAVKALKQQAAPADRAPTKPAMSEAAPKSDAKAAPPSSGKPVPGVDYEVIEITEDMDPSEVRKARISNAKAKAAAMKTFKESGGMVISQQPTTGSEPQDESPAVKGVQESSTELPTDIPRPDLIPINDDMEPAEVRRARIHNAKAKAAFKKALKEAGIDPATVAD